MSISYFSFVYIVVFHRKNGSQIIYQKFYECKVLRVERNECKMYAIVICLCNAIYIYFKFLCRKDNYIHPYTILFILFINKLMNMINIHIFSKKIFAQHILGFLFWSCKQHFKTSLLVYQKHRQTQFHIENSLQMRFNAISFFFFLSLSLTNLSYKVRRGRLTWCWLFSKFKFSTLTHKKGIDKSIKFLEAS